MKDRRTVATVTSKGRVTIPLTVRRRLGLEEGDRLEFVAENGVTVLRPVRNQDDPLEGWASRLPTFSSVEEVNAWVREMRDEDEFTHASLSGS